MKVLPECYPCALRQAMRTLEILIAEGHLELNEEGEQKLRGEITRKVEHKLALLSAGLTPAELSYQAIRLVCDYVPDGDPYLRLKRESNHIAREVLPQMREWVATSDDPIQSGALVAAAGNIIDLGIKKDFDLDESLAHVREEGFARADLALFKQMLDQTDKSHGKVLYICDNAGEIVLDRVFLELLVERYPNIEWVAGVNAGPVLNDALREDAEFAELDSLARVVDNGYDCLGTVLEEVSPEFRSEFDSASVVISKGQANFETLDGRSDKVFFLLKAKCESVAAYLKVRFHDTVFVRGQVA